MIPSSPTKKKMPLKTTPLHCYISYETLRKRRFVVFSTIPKRKSAINASSASGD
jgi:hypothetical protein